MAKYQEAPKLISGIGINPPVDIPLADDYPFFDDPADAVMHPDALNVTSLDLFHSIKPEYSPRQSHYQLSLCPILCQMG